VTAEAAALAAPAPHAGLRDRFSSMGTEVTVLLPTGRDDAAAVARDVIAAWEGRFSRFHSDSELSALNAAAGRGDGFVASAALFEAASTALQAAAATDGLFDPLLGARLVALGYDRTFAQLVDGRPASGLGPWQSGRWQEVITDPATRRIWLPAGTALDLGGIAKGMAVDAALHAVVHITGVAWAAVNAGGDLAVHGLPPGVSAWPIAVEGLGERVLTIRDGAVATSTVLERRWRSADGGWRHHLIDPRTGHPSDSDVSLASVAAATCAQAEVAAKVALLLGVHDGTAFLQRHGLTGVLVETDGTERWVLA
jgi:thiamine biosynthesis lipoprotein